MNPRIAIAGFVLAAAICAPGGAAAQGLDAEGARETIIDAPVVSEEKPVAEENERIADAIGRAAESAAEVRKRFNIGKVDIVFVKGLAEEGSPLAQTISAHAASIEALRKEIEGSAIFYHAIDSQQVLLRDVVAVEFGDDGAVTIFVARPAAG
jgi:hypothetical protein